MDIGLLLPAPPSTVVPRASQAVIENAVEQLFAPPAVDAQQVPLHHRVQTDSGARRLALAVLEDALQCVVKHHASRVREQRVAAAEALSWIESADSSTPFTFCNLCEVFSLDPDWLRRRVRSQIARPARRSEPSGSRSAPGLARTACG